MEKKNPYELSYFMRGRNNLPRYERAAITELLKNGYLVLLTNLQPKEGIFAKPQIHWNGPYRAIKKLIKLFNEDGNTKAKIQNEDESFGTISPLWKR